MTARLERLSEPPVPFTSTTFFAFSVPRPNR
jgi:hypothetical protein